jgi:putative FmdB family regulatory protein
MPIYEYACRRCKEEFQTLIMSASDEGTLVCPTCGSRRLDRLISRVAYHQSEKDRLDSYDPGTRHGDGFYKDSRNIGLQAKKRAQQMGVDLGSGFESKLEKLRTDPGSVLKDSE